MKIFDIGREKTTRESFEYQTKLSGGKKFERDGEKKATQLALQSAV